MRIYFLLVSILFIQLSNEYSLHGQCGEISAGNYDADGCTSGCTLCPGDEILLDLEGCNLPDAGTIDWFVSTASGFDPYSETGTPIAISNITTNFPEPCDEAPVTYGGWIDSQSSPEQQGEFFVLSSGSGFNTDDFEVDYPIENNSPAGTPNQNGDVAADGSADCGIQGGNTGLVTGCTNVMSAGPGVDIPAGAYVIFQTSADFSQSIDVSTLCATDPLVEIYVISSSCNRTIGALSNGNADGFRNYTFQFGCGSTTWGYDTDDPYIDPSPPNPAPGNGTFMFNGAWGNSQPSNVLPDGFFITEYGCENSDVTGALYTVPFSQCNASGGPITYYINGAVNPEPAADGCLNVTPPEFSYTVDCQPIPMQSYGSTICDAGSTSLDLFDVVPIPTGSWVGIQPLGVESYITSNTFNAESAYAALGNGVDPITFTIEYQPSEGCYIDTEVAITVAPQQDIILQNSNFNECPDAFGSVDLNNYLSATSDPVSNWIGDGTSSALISGSTFDLSSATPGIVYNITAENSFVCGDTEDFTISIENFIPPTLQPANIASSVCENISFDLTPILAALSGDVVTFYDADPATGANAIGDPSSYSIPAGSGTLNFWVEYSDGTCSILYQFSIDYNALFDWSTIGYSEDPVIICSSTGSAMIDLNSYFSSGSPANVFWLASDQTTQISDASSVTVFDGDSFYPASENNGCTSLNQDPLTFSIVNEPDASWDPSTLPTICEGQTGSVDLNTLLNDFTQTGGTWTLLNDNSVIPAGIFDYTDLVEDTYSIEYSLGSIGCLDDDLQTIIIEAGDDSTWDNSEVYCESPFLVVDLDALANQVGGIWTDWNDTEIIDGDLDIGGQAIGLYEITYTLGAGTGCEIAASLEIEIQATTNASWTIDYDLCFANTETLDLNTLFTDNATTGGSWTQDAIEIIDGVWDYQALASGQYTMEYTVMNDNGLCPSTFGQNIEILAIPNEPTGLQGDTLCVNDVSVDISVDDPGNGFTVQWFTDVIEPPVATGIVLTVTEPGIYYVNYMNNDCEGEIAFIEVIESTSMLLTESDFSCLDDNLNYDLSVVVSGGIAPYILSVSDGTSSTVTMVTDAEFTIEGIPNNEYVEVTIVDAAGCEYIVNTNPRSCDCEDIPVPEGITMVEYCHDQAIPELSIDDNGETYDILWYSATDASLATNTYTFTPTIAGTYFVIFVEDDCESLPFIIDLVELPAITIDISAIDCVDEDFYQVLFSVSGGSDVYSSVTVGSYTVINMGSNEYSAEGIPIGTNTNIAIVDDDDCSTSTIISSPNCACDIIDPDINTTIICVGDAIPALSVTAPPTIFMTNWFSDIDGQNIITTGENYVPSTTGNYYVQYSDENGCESNIIDASVSAVTLDASWTIPGPFCVNDGPFDLTTTPITDDSGEFSGAGIFVTGVFTPAGAGDGLHTVTYTVTQGDCSVDIPQDIQVIEVVASFDSTVVCESQGVIDLNDLLTGDTGGSWSGTGVTDNEFNPSGLIGPYAITYELSIGDCDDSFTTFIQVTDSADPSWAPEIICEGETIVDLADFISGTIGGTFTSTDLVITNNTIDPSTLSMGNYNITYTVGEDACEATETEVLSVASSLNALWEPTTLCVDQGPYDLNQLLTTGAIGGNWSSDESGLVSGDFIEVSGFAPGNYNVTYTVGSGSCETSLTDQITITQAANATVEDASVCALESAIYLPDLVLGDAGGIWTGPGVTPLDSFSLAGLAVNAYQLTYTVGNSFCENDDIAEITILDNPIAFFMPDTLCQNSDTLDMNFLLTPTSTFNGQWSDDSGIVTIDGVLDLSLLPIGPHEVTYMVDNGACDDSYTESIIIVEAPDATITNPVSICIDELPFDLTSLIEGDTGGIFEINSVAGDIFNPSPADIQNYSVSYSLDNGFCIANYQVTFSLDSIPVIAFMATEICDQSEPYDLNSLLPVAQQGGIWSGNAVTDNALDLDVYVPGTDIFYDVENGNCVHQEILSLDILEAPNASWTTFSICASDAPMSLFDVLQGDIGGTWTGGTYISANNEFDPSGMNSGLYDVTYTVDNGTCESVITQAIEVIEEVVLNAGPDVSICLGDIIQLEGTSTVVNGNIWVSNAGGSFGNANELNTTFDASTATAGQVVLTLTSTASCGAVVDDEMMVTILEAGQIELTAPNSILIGESTEILATGSSSYIWTDNVSLSCTDCDTPTVSPLVTTTYFVASEDECITGNNITIEVIDNRMIIFPTAFSPNGDIYNETFQPIQVGVDQYVLEIYNRWGTKVFETNEVGFGWNGSINGEDQEIGVYVYRCIYRYFGETTDRELKGNITLVR